MVFLFVLITFYPILNGFLKFWTNSDIQDGGRHSEMIRHLMMRASKETFSDVLSTLQVSLS